VKRCACGRCYDPLDPSRRVGTQSVGGEVLLLMNCDCGSTGAIVLVPHRDDVLERLLDDSEPLYSHERDAREVDAA